MALESLVWLPAGSEARDHQAKTLVRAKATAWSHQSGERKGNVSVSKPWRVVQNLAPDHFLQFPVGASAGRSSHNAARQAERRKTTEKQKTQPRVCDKQPLLYQPALSGDERFGRRLHFVLPRFGAIAGEDGLEWLSKFSKRENVLLQGALGALISGLDFKSNPIATRRCCAEILPHVRHWLSNPRAHNNHDTLVLIFLLSFHELLVWSNAKAWMTHLWGMSEIMRKQGPRFFCSASALMTFRLYRHFGVALDILLRRRSFLEDPAWIHEPWRDHGEKDLVDYAVDVLVHVPGMIESVDCILAGRQAAESLQEKIAYLIGALHDWRVHRLDPFVLQEYGRAIDLDTLVRSITEKTLVDAFLARAIVLHLTTWLFLTRLGQEGSLPWSASDTVDNILDICEEYSYHQEGAGILPWTFSIRAALFTDSTMASAMRGRDLCARLESRFSLGMLSDIIGSLPGLNTKMEFNNGCDAATPPRPGHEVSQSST